MISENIWDPFSTTQTSRMVAIVQKLVSGYPSVVNAENKNTQVSLFWFFFVSILGKLRNLGVFVIHHIGKNVACLRRVKKELFGVSFSAD